MVTSKASFKLGVLATRSVEFAVLLTACSFSVVRAQSAQYDTTCKVLYNKANGYSNNFLWQMEYDTAKKYVEQCSYDPNVTWGFIFMTEAIGHLGNVGQRRADYLSWLKSVLYLNTKDPEYFCQCVEAIAGELAVPKTYWPDTGFNYPLAVYQWLIQNTGCDSARLRQEYDQTRSTQYQMWSNDPSAYKLDTTLPTMQQLGLDTLLAKHFLYASVSEKTGPNILTSVTASPNPLQGGTTLSFGMNQDAYVKIELFDVLGNRVSGNGYGFPASEAFYPSGNHSVAVSLSGLASGTYYARISTSFGESQTVKLVKE